METTLISQLLTAGGIGAELVFDGPTAECPQCNELSYCGLTQAA
jgi:uncharacterized protein (UPF0179 family)